MRILSLVTLFLMSSICLGQNTAFYDLADEFFSDVVQEGKVDYQYISENPQKLDKLVDYLAENSWTEAEEKAYLINAYNILVIAKIVKHYPVNSPMEISGFFDDKDQNLNGKKVSLNQIENNYLRAGEVDERIHFVLVCAAVSCPPIIPNAYKPDSIDEQLETQTKKALNDPQFVYQSHADEAVYISEIFKWYQEDFGKSKDDVLKFINSYRDEPFNTDYKIQYYDYNWSLNDIKASKYAPLESPINEEFDLQTFTAGSLLKKGSWDFTLFNSLYTETRQNWLGQDLSGYRATFNTHLVQLTYGISKTGRFNLGLDLNIRNTGRSVNPGFEGLAPAFQYANNDSARFGLTSAGIRARIQPFKKAPSFTIQSTLTAPTIRSAEGSGGPDNLFWADWNRLTWWNQFFYDKTFADFQLFSEIDLWFRFPIFDNQYTTLDIPLNVFFSYFPTQKWTIYLMTQHLTRFVYDSEPQNNTDWPVGANYTASGGGIKYNFESNFQIEVLYTNFWRGKNNGLGQTFNLGLKYILS